MKKVTMRGLFRILTLFMILFVTQNKAKMMRNSALISKMVSHFQGKENLSIEPATENPKSGNVLSIMQNVLCRNFPSIPCSLIIKDETLKNLIEKSIQQIKYKKLSMEKTTPLPGSHLTLFPVMNSEDLSNFLQVSETGYYKEKQENHKQKKTITNWSKEKPKKKKKKESKVMSVYNGRKKIRRFYPHKIKYKDKNNKNVRRDFESEEKLSMSVEVPDNTGRKINYQTHPIDSPVWRIDYMKHGEPSLNMFGYENDRMQSKIMKTGPNVIVDENVLEQVARKDVLHPDVYIKKNYVRKKSIDVNSEAMD